MREREVLLRRGEKKEIDNHFYYYGYYKTRDYQTGEQSSRYHGNSVYYYNGYVPHARLSTRENTCGNHG